MRESEVTYLEDRVELEDFAPLFTFQPIGNVCRDTLEIEGSLRLQTALVSIQAFRPVEL
jgi:hypothetical protein